MLEDGRFICVDCNYITSKRSNWFKHRRKHLGNVQFWPKSEKAGLWGHHPSLTLTYLYSHRKKKIKDI